MNQTNSLQGNTHYMKRDADSLLDTLSEVIAEGNDLEGLVRPLLELLESITGLGSTYLTTIDLERNIQTILFSHNRHELSIPEGLEVRWGDTLCKRALDEGRPFTEDVAGCWGDSEAARDLGISTYYSAPIRCADGELFGTLCGASASQVTVDERAYQILELFGHLIARQIDRERLIDRLRHENQDYAQQALQDPLTGLANRRALVRELTRALRSPGRSGGIMYVAVIDLDRFKEINDTYGHDAGDRFLIAIAQRLADGLRDTDFVARNGGDEFVVFSHGGTHDDADRSAAFAERLQGLTLGPFIINDQLIPYAGASVGVAPVHSAETSWEDAIARADAAMYEVKELRKRG
ncbi:MAG: sensor domain-containing diguanylate cyclase [Halofilum sp. (in: g-proteobacteria)]